MNNLFKSVIFTSLLLILSGCFSSNEENVHTSEVTVEEIMKLYPDADIFQYSGVIYQTNSTRGNEQNLTIGDEIMKIEEQSSDPSHFSDGFSTILPIGTPIYEVVEQTDVLIAEVDGEFIHYFANVEG